MAKHGLRYLIIGLFIWAGVSACSDHLTSSPTPGAADSRLRVKRITQEVSANVAKVSQFQYDAQGRLGAIRLYQSPDSTISEVEQVVYQYDQNRLLQLRREVTLYPRNSQPNLVEQYTYAYDAAGKITGLTYANGFALTFAYNSANQLASSGRFFATSGLTLTGSDSFTFTGSNLTGVTSVRSIPTRGGPALSSTSVSTFTYDGKANPFYGVYIIPAPYPNGFVNLTFSPRLVETYFGGVDNALTLSQNNILSSLANGVTTTYEYEYNAANLPVVRRTNVNNVVTQTLRFEYETY
jgi:YD repeat-containing protein